MPRSAIVLFVLAAMAIASPAKASAPTAAVMPLGKGAGGAQYDGLGRALADMMVTDLSNSNVLQLVERMKLGLVLDELKLAKSGYLDKGSAQKLGRGLGAKFVITGSFSVVKQQFIIDARIIEVESGSIVKAARSAGLVDDFIAIEKDVVEQLLDGLKVKLSPGARRRILIDSPTESATALASYGRGLEAGEAGKVEVAQKAFEEALRQDPDFAKASLALRDLATSIEQARKSERKHYQDLKQRGIESALKVIPAETSRPAGFKDTQATAMDFAIREQLLGRAGRHCQRYAELKHYLLRKKGELHPWFDGLAGSYWDRYRAGERLVEQRTTQLKLAGRGTEFGSDSRDIMFRSALNSGKQLLLYGTLTPEKFHSTLIAVMTRCHAPAVQLSEFEVLAKHARKWSWYSKPLSRTYNVGPSTLTARDSIDLYWAYLRALHRGVDRKVRTRTDAVLARHPEGDPNRYQVINRISEVVVAGESRERRVATRMKLSAKSIVEKARAMRSGDAQRVHLGNAMCKSFHAAQRTSVDSAWETYQETQSTGRPEKLESGIDRLAASIGPLVYAGCFRARKKAPSTLKRLFAALVRDLKRVHPARASDKRCREQANRLQRDLGNAQLANLPRLQLAAITKLQSMQQQRCLMP